MIYERFHFNVMDEQKSPFFRRLVREISEETTDRVAEVIFLQHVFVKKLVSV